jgi:hypothetical protein
LFALFPPSSGTTGRGVGPSTNDFLFGEQSFIDIPGVLVDYMEDIPGSLHIPAGHQIDAPAELYSVNPPDRRPLP